MQASILELSEETTSLKSEEYRTFAHRKAVPLIPSRQRRTLLPQAKEEHPET